MKPNIRPQPRQRQKPSQKKGPLLSSGLKVAILLGGILLSGVIFYVWLQVQVVNLSYDISRAQKQRKELVEINKKLRIQLANMKAPDRIEQIALNQLGLRAPQRGQIEILP
ncbi:MAG: cell division protein FtsL [Deltaproteobacteria bacterium]|nr:cell division protein FtsL [Deltaproteobacteria bacterium]